MYLRSKKKALREFNINHGLRLLKHNAALSQQRFLYSFCGMGKDVVFANGVIHVLFFRRVSCVENCAQRTRRV